MKKLWQDIQAHRRAAVLFLVYWVATMVVFYVRWNKGTPFPVVLLFLTTPLIAGMLVGLWRASTPERMAHLGDRIRGGMMAGLLCTEITFLVMKGGAVEEVIGWIHGHKFQGDEVLGFSIVAGIFGIILGLVGAAFTLLLERFRRLTSPLHPPEAGKS
jgi:hypothetical protein